MIDLTGIDWVAVDREQARDAANPPPWEPPRVLPPAWCEVERDITGAKYLARSRGLSAIVSCSQEQDGRWWMHLSVSHRNRVPTWQELAWCKDVFIGDREAYQVLPPKARYINIHPNVLHMFALLDGSAALPDFTRGTGSL
jgi:hypothetical protein